MSQASKSTDEMRPEYDIRGGVRGKYYERYRAGTNVVLLERDVAEVFRDSESVNRALRLLVNVAQASAASERGRALTLSGLEGPSRTRRRRRAGSSKASAAPKRG